MRTRRHTRCYRNVALSMDRFGSPIPAASRTKRCSTPAPTTTDPSAITALSWRRSARKWIAATENIVNRRPCLCTSHRLNQQNETNVKSAALLREAAPVGAALLPVRPLDSAPLLTVNLLEYDLAAGSGPTQLIAVCEALRNASCVLFEVSIASTNVTVDAGQLLPDIAAVVESTEVQP